MRARRNLKTFVLTLMSCLLPTLAIGQATVNNYNSITDDRLINPEDSNWLSYRGTLDGWGYSALDEINERNVDELEPVWSFSTGVLGGHESPPIVNDGVMFITTPGNLLYAIEAASGDLLWRYQHNLPETYIAFHRTNRGVALGYGSSG
jgi:alcohol dehydrogenase (cytochrome c)